MDNTALIVSNCLKTLGYSLLSQDAYSTNNQQILEGYIKLAERYALKQDRFDVLDILEFSGLIMRWRFKNA